MAYYTSYDSPYATAGPYAAEPPPVYAYDAPPVHVHPPPPAYTYYEPAPASPVHAHIPPPAFGDLPPPSYGGYATAGPYAGGPYYDNGYGQAPRAHSPPPAIEPPREYRDYSPTRGRPATEPNPWREPERDRDRDRRDFDDTRSVARSTFSLAMTGTTIHPGENFTLKLVEELLMLKAGDRPMFSKSDRVLDMVCSVAILYELWLQGRIAISPENRVDSRNVVVRLVDDAPTGSRMIDSAIAHLKKKQKVPTTVEFWMDRAGKSITPAVLWRLVQKKRLAFDPRTIGPDKYPVVDGQGVAELRERIIRVVEHLDEPDLHDQILAVLYYMPKDATPKVFPYSVNDLRVDEARTIAKAAISHLVQFKRDDKWI